MGSKSLFVLLRLSHGPGVIGTEGMVGPLLGLLASIQGIGDSTIGSWGPGLEEWIVRWRSYLRMRPLWRALRGAFPEIVLSSPRRDAVYRRVIEINDGQRLLRPYRNPAVATAATAVAIAAGLSNADADAVAEAAVLRAALHGAKASGRPPSDDAEIETAPIPPDPDAQTEWLKKVAVAFARSPLVRQALQTAQVDSQHTGRETET